MIDYQKIERVCRESSAISGLVIDDFLINYAASHDKLEHEARVKLGKYKHITRNLGRSVINYLISQYIAHRIFRKDGLISKYLKHSALKGLLHEQKSFLLQQADTPWRFCFSMITANPAHDFYEMEDVFSQESFLLYSPGTADILKSGNKTLWFNLIGFNGYCWQSFGPINAYKSFEPDDIFFYATETTPYLEDETDIINHIESHPVPYMMLISGSEYPVTFHKNDQVVINQAEYHKGSFDLKQARRQFEMESANNVHRYSLKGWDDFPHFAYVYYDKDAKTLLLTAMTDKGFSKLAGALGSEGLDIPEDPDLRLNPAMLVTAGNILNRTIVLNPYEELFTKKTSPAEQEELDKINNVMNLILPDINAGREPDLQALSEKTGMDVKTIQTLASNLFKSRH